MRTGRQIGNPVHVLGRHVWEPVPPQPDRVFGKVPLHIDSWTGLRALWGDCFGVSQCGRKPVGQFGREALRTGSRAGFCISGCDWETVQDFVRICFKQNANAQTSASGDMSGNFSRQVPGHVPGVHGPVQVYAQVSGYRLRSVTFLCGRPGVQVWYQRSQRHDRFPDTLQTLARGLGIRVDASADRCLYIFPDRSAGGWDLIAPYSGHK